MSTAQIPDFIRLIFLAMMDSFGNLSDGIPAEHFEDRTVHLLGQPAKNRVHFLTECMRARRFFDSHRYGIAYLKYGVYFRQRDRIGVFFNK